MIVSAFVSGLPVLFYPSGFGVVRKQFSPLIGERNACSSVNLMLLKRKLELFRLIYWTPAGLRRGPFVSGFLFFFPILRISELSENCSPRLSASETPAAVSNLMLFGEETRAFSSYILEACGSQTRVDFSLQMPFISCARG
ncbi:hypothetical protein CEXT_320481 [Caerostris extrusa]|uniref:Uncharacterized protein n=1 Tax=Caerostris extrusa TaxID=172846 RepID=A0AAV4XCK9_CAEEX|nr:hypothetical protein CEXT_320481 [Caerostris extrusa]